MRPGSVEDRAGREPDRVILREGDATMTWGQIDDQADRLAEGLDRHGVAAGDVVAVRTQIRMEWVVIDTALAKLGARLLGVNWRLTPSELRFVLGDSGATALICDDADPSAVAPGIVAVSLDVPAPGFLDYRDLVTGPCGRRLSGAPAPLVIYTSGTTGRPKGVVSRVRPGHEQEAQEYAADVAAQHARRPGDVHLATMPFSHGAGPSQVRGCLRSGVTVVFLRRFEPVAALDVMRRHGVTTWVAVPTLLMRLASLPEDVLAARRPTTLRHLATGAAPVPMRVKEWVAGYFGDILHEGYGTTEVGMITQVTPAMRAERPATSGRPYRHVRVEIRDGAGVPLPAGATGDIWAWTPVGIAAYLGAGLLGSDVVDAEGFFRTGDVGHLDHGGHLFITDRATDMIVSGGVNIYPAEVEAALLALAPVQDAAVIGVPDDEFGEQVRAFVELRPGARATVADLLHGVRDTLASYKRPRSVEIVDELPRNVMGKLLKKDLRAPYWEGRERQV